MVDLDRRGRFRREDICGGVGHGFCRTQFPREEGNERSWPPLRIVLSEPLNALVNRDHFALRHHSSRLRFQLACAFLALIARQLVVSANCGFFASGSER